MNEYPIDKIIELLKLVGQEGFSAAVRAIVAQGTVDLVLSVIYAIVAVFVTVVLVRRIFRVRAKVREELRRDSYYDTDDAGIEVIICFVAIIIAVGVLALALAGIGSAMQRLAVPEYYALEALARLIPR